MSRVLTVLSIPLVLLVLLAGPATAAAPGSDPFRLGWPGFTETVPADGPASAETGCARGSTVCVDQVVAAMQTRYGGLGCSHDAIFSLLYLRTTQEYRRSVSDPAFFKDNAWVNHEDAVFADLYFKAFDRYRAGALGDVPPAWRITFYAAQQRKVTGLGDMLLGMSAHIRRDLPFVLYAVGLVDANGVSREADHTRVNDILAVVNRYALYEVATRYDPTVGDGHAPSTTMDSRSLQNLVTRWRAQAWTDAQRLAAARTPAIRLQVAQSIDDAAASAALGLMQSYALGPREDSSARDAYCAAHAGG
jgi:hypothetical protein